MLIERIRETQSSQCAFRSRVQMHFCGEAYRKSAERQIPLKSSVLYMPRRKKHISWKEACCWYNPKHMLVLMCRSVTKMLLFLKSLDDDQQTGCGASWWSLSGGHSSPAHLIYAVRWLFISFFTSTECTRYLIIGHLGPDCSARWIKHEPETAKEKRTFSNLWDKRQEVLTRPNTFYQTAFHTALSFYEHFNCGVKYERFSQKENLLLLVLK